MVDKTKRRLEVGHVRPLRKGQVHPVGQHAPPGVHVPHMVVSSN